MEFRVVLFRSQVVLDLNVAVFRVARELLPARERVVYGLAPWTLRKAAVRFQPYPEHIKHRNGSLVPRFAPRLGFRAGKLALDGVELLDLTQCILGPRGVVVLRLEEVAPRMRPAAIAGDAGQAVKVFIGLVAVALQRTLVSIQPRGRPDRKSVV